MLQVDAQQEEMLTWQDRWYQNKKVQNVVSQSRMMGKVKANIKIKLKDPNEQDEESSKAAAASTGEEGGAASSKEPAQKPTVEELPEMIGSMEEYATLVGKSVDEIEKEAEEVESSEEEEDGEDDPLWGAILGKK